MAHPGHHAIRDPSGTALVDAATGESMTWIELHRSAVHAANLLHGQGLRKGDAVAWCIRPVESVRSGGRAARTSATTKDETKTRESRTAGGQGTFGDIGYLDDEGYLYLTDRKSFTINAGGINIYPREIEEVLLGHPDVDDVAVFGVPNTEYGEEVKAVVQLREGLEGGPETTAELGGLCLTRLARFKCPRSIDFDLDLPREPTGKLRKHLIRDRYL